MKVEVWSDFSCPFCYIGVHNFYLALDTYNDECKREESLIFNVYDLNPNAPLTTDLSYHEVLAQKYDVPLDRAQEMTENAGKIAQEAGLILNPDKTVAVSTSIAHRLVTWVQQHQPKKVRGLVMRLFKAFFENGENIADDQVLAAIMVEQNITGVTLPEILTDLEVSKIISVNQAEAQGFDIKSVPFFVFNRIDAVAGAQTPVNFYQLIKQINESSKIND